MGLCVSEEPGAGQEPGSGPPAGMMEAEQREGGRELACLEPDAHQHPLNGWETLEDPSQGAVTFP